MYVLSFPPLQRMVAPATAATAVWLGSEAAYAKEAPPKVDLDKVRASVMDIIDNDEEKRGDGSECLRVLLVSVDSVALVTDRWLYVCPKILFCTLLKTASLKGTFVRYVRWLFASESCFRTTGFLFLTAFVFFSLAWHCAGTYKAADNSGGSNGAMMRFKPEGKGPNWHDKEHLFVYCIVL
jgi:hypothetical protein